ncbi:MAG: elongation factor G, partial [Bacteroidales bacterium]|nr:elongation factor G [Bacteroidales bacterium]
MKIYNTQDIRNIALLGGAKSGKTTLAEAMAFEGKAITRMGSVDDKNTASDYRDIETEKQISVTASLLYAEFNDRKINILDTPGTPDFIGEPIGA